MIIYASILEINLIFESWFQQPLWEKFGEVGMVLVWVQASLTRVFLLHHQLHLTSLQFLNLFFRWPWHIIATNTFHGRAFSFFGFVSKALQSLTSFLRNKNNWGFSCFSFASHTRKPFLKMISIASSLFVSSFSQWRRCNWYLFEEDRVSLVACKRIQTSESSIVFIHWGGWH